MPNNNKPMVDLPYFELCNQAPTASSAIGCMTTTEEGNDRYIYMITGALFYRYDVIADTWQQLASPNVTPTVTASLRYTRRRGYHAPVLAATSNTVTIAAPRGANLEGETLRVLTGIGAGQERVLTLVSEAIHEAGTITTTAGGGLTDSTKKWRVNQWAGYMVAVTMGPTVPQYKRIIANDATILYVQATGLEPHEPWANQVFGNLAPYTIPTTGAQYQIMSSTFSVDTPWATAPGERALCTALTGGIYLQSCVAAAPFLSLQYYDVAADSWQTKTVPQGLQIAAVTLDSGIERTAKTGAVHVTGTATSAAARTLTDSLLSLEPGRYANHRVLITGGTGAGQNRRIVTNTATTFTLPRNWDVQPDATSTYEVWPDFDRIYFNGAANATMLAYSPESDFWMQGQSFDDGVVAAVSCTLGSEMPVGVSTGARIAAGVRSINPVPTAAGSNYVFGDLLTCSVGGAGAQVRVTSVGASGAVTGLELVHAGTGTGYTVGTGKATTGGAGTGCTIEIMTVGATALVTTLTTHWFKTGQVVTFAGCTDAAWNAAHTIIGVNALSAFSVAVTAAASMGAALAQSTTTITDAAKNWIVNEHAGRLVHLMVNGTAPTSQIRWIVSNTANTLTVATIAAAANGTAKYAIYDSKIFGIDDQRKEPGMSGNGFATGGSTTTLTDTSKNWDVNMWAGYAFKVEAGPGYGSGRIVVISNTDNTLTYATQTFTPTADTLYEIADTWGIATSGASNTINDTAKKWAANQWITKRIRITGGTTSVGTEIAATANTATALTAVVGTPDATSTYAILSAPPRGAGTALLWAWGATDPAKRGRYMFSPRGGASSAVDIYDIVTQRWSLGWSYRGATELFATGSSYTYDGHDSLYLSRSIAAAPIRIFRYDINTNRMDGLATTTVLQNAVHIGNYMETVDSPDGYKFLYTLQNTGTLLQRALIS
jgi:hypothetical protein